MTFLALITSPVKFIRAAFLSQRLLHSREIFINKVTAMWTGLYLFHVAASNGRNVKKLPLLFARALLKHSFLFKAVQMRPLRFVSRAKIPHTNKTVTVTSEERGENQHIGRLVRTRKLFKSHGGPGRPGDLDPSPLRN